MAATIPKPSSLLRHLHLPSPTTYHHASRIQSRLVRSHLAHKASLTTTTTAPPPPTIITFSPAPIYTTGRRDLHTPISSTQAQLLTSPLLTCTLNNDGSIAEKQEVAEIFQAERGGQITFHGPGQFVIYPIIDLRSTSTSTPPSTTTLSPRCYVSLLESITINTLAHYGITGIRTSNPGVWVNDDSKIAALGVHLRRFISSHGVGLNVCTDMRWFERIVACGLEGKGVTSMVKEKQELEGLGVDEVADVWVREFASAIGISEGVVRVEEKEVMGE